MRKLSSIRKDLGYNQEEMAKALDISLSSYQRKENGVTPLLAMELMKVSKLSGVPASEIEIPC